MNKPPRGRYARERQQQEQTQKKSGRNLAMKFVPVFVILMVVVFVVVKHKLETEANAGRSPEMTVIVGEGASVSGDDPQLRPTPSPTPQSELITDINGMTTQFEGAEKVDLEKELGYYSCTPVHGSQIPLGVDRVALYFARTDLKRGTGIIRIVADETDTVLYARPFTHVTERRMTENELKFYGYLEGCCFVFELDTPLTLAGDMRVELSEGCLVSDKYDSLVSGAAGGKNWRFRVLPFGVCRSGEDTLKDVGETSDYSVVLGGDAVRAEVENLTPSIVEVSEESFTKTGVLTLTFIKKGEATVQVKFYSASGALAGDSASLITAQVGSGILKPLD